MGCLAAYRLLEKGRFTDCPSSDATKEGWQLETDQVRQFVEASCVVEKHARVASSSLFGAYRSWANQVGIQGTLSQNTFSSRLQALGLKPHRGAQGERQVVGLKLSSLDFLN
jgi:putative DNA primase/helicase